MSEPHADNLHGASCTIRRVTESDLAAVVQLFAAHAHYERAAFNPAGKREALRRALAQPEPRLLLWVAECEREIAGYASASVEFSTWNVAGYLHMDCLFVSPAWRNRNIGLSLMRAVMDAAVAQGLDELQWQTPEWNHDAKRFYRRLGATESAKTRFRFTLDARYSEDAEFVRHAGRI